MFHGHVHPLKFVGENSVIVDFVHAEVEPCDLPGFAYLGLLETGEHLDLRIRREFLVHVHQSYVESLLVLDNGVDLVHAAVGSVNVGASSDFWQFHGVPGAHCRGDDPVFADYCALAVGRPILQFYADVVGEFGD